MLRRFAKAMGVSVEELVGDRKGGQVMSERLVEPIPEKTMRIVCSGTRKDGEPCLAAFEISLVEFAKGIGRLVCPYCGKSFGCSIIRD
jgi:hypothetical protein